MTEAQQMCANGKNGCIVYIEFTDDGVRVLADVEDDHITERQFCDALEVEFGLNFTIRHQSGFWFATGKREVVA